MTGKKSSSSSGSGSGSSGGGGGSGGKSSHSQSTRSGGGGQAQKSDNSVIKEGGWSSRHNFMQSYGIKPYEQGAYGEGKAILDGFRDASK